MDLLQHLRRSERLRLLRIGEVSSLREGLPVVGVEQIVSATQTLSTQFHVYCDAEALWMPVSTRS
eukprot:scaffold6500_cov100-Skeletonema_marinoi.AAC.4